MERDWNQEAHNEGQEDGAKGEYDNPYKGDIFGWGYDEERSQKYDEGYENGRNNRS